MRCAKNLSAELRFSSSAVMGVPLPCISISVSSRSTSLRSSATISKYGARRYSVSSDGGLAPNGIFSTSA